MTREQITGFMFGISVGTAIGFYLRQPAGNSQELPFTETSQRTTALREVRDPQTDARPSSSGRAGKSYPWSGKTA